MDARSPRVRAARRLLERSGRARTGRFLVPGPQAAREALAGHGSPVVPGGPTVRVLDLFVTDVGADRHADLVRVAEDAGIPVHRTDDAVLAELDGTPAPQGVVAVARTLDVGLDLVLGHAGATPQRAPRLVAVLADVRDPGNAGTVIRTADAAGADAVVLAGGSVDPYHPKAVRAGVGSVFHLPVVRGLGVAETVEALRAAGFQVLAADGRGAADLDDLQDSGALTAPTAWVFGNEAWGLPEPVLALTDQAVAVPIHGRAESLNLATAAAVCLYASARAQRRR
jgi:TrmH family RNA methyltransferase